MSARSTLCRRCSPRPTRRTRTRPSTGSSRTVTDGTTVFDAVSWSDVSWSDVSWDAVSWSDVSWSDVSWDAVSWSDVSWTDVSWSDVSWSDVSWEDNADGETPRDGDGYELTPAKRGCIGRRPADAGREGCTRCGQEAAAAKAAPMLLQRRRPPRSRLRPRRLQPRRRGGRRRRRRRPQQLRSRRHGSRVGRHPASPSPFRVNCPVRASIGGCPPPNPAYPPIRPSRSVELLSILCGIEGDTRHEGHRRTRVSAIPLEDAIERASSPSSARSKLPPKALAYFLRRRAPARSP